MTDSATDPAIKPTETQPAPNISTEHQREGDARLPSDTLDRDQPPEEPEDYDRGPGTSPV